MFWCVYHILGPVTTGITCNPFAVIYTCSVHRCLGPRLTHTSPGDGASDERAHCSRQDRTHGPNMRGGGGSSRSKRRELIATASTEICFIFVNELYVPHESSCSQQLSWADRLQFNTSHIMTYGGVWSRSSLYSLPQAQKEMGDKVHASADISQGTSSS
jgi:hypothetical protein